MLIHGKEGSGASLYTVVLASKWFELGYDILFLCGYEMAQQEFNKLTTQTSNNITFYTKERVNNFLSDLQCTTEKSVIFVKNIELFDSTLFASLEGLNNIILSGDVSTALAKDTVQNRQYTTRIYFSPLPEIALPGLKKYEGFVIAEGIEGITSLQ